MSEPPAKKWARPTVAAEDGPEGGKSPDHQPEANLIQYPPGGKVRALLEILGPKTVLLQVRARKKSPWRKQWQRFDVERMKDPTYLKELEASPNIAVLLGSASDNLCSIDVDGDDDFKSFLALNPKLKCTLRSRGSRGGNAWIRVIGDYPSLGKIPKADGHPWGEWRADGGCTMIYGIHPNGMAYKLSSEREIVALTFDEIIWPDGLLLPSKTKQQRKKGRAAADENDGIARQPVSTRMQQNPALQAHEELVDEFGEPVFIGSDKSGNQRVTGINEAYWAALYAKESDVIYNVPDATFWGYQPTTGLYAKISRDRIKQDVSRRLLDYSRQESGFEDIERRRNDRMLNAIASQLAGIAGKSDAFERQPGVLHLKNGMLSINGSEAALEGFAPRFRSRARIPVEFDPHQTCPRFLNELIGPAVKEDDVLLLQKIAGQAVVGVNDIQRFVVLMGAAGRGKSQFVELLQNLVGLENCTQLRTQHLHERFELFRFQSKKLLIGVDVDADFLSSKGAPVIKGLVGGDTFDAEEKGGTASFPIQGRFNVIMTTNCRLRVKLQGDTDAWRRRMVIVRFEAPPPNRRIPRFAEELLREEGPGILNWALAGWVMLLKDIKEMGDIYLTPRQRGAVDSILGGSDHLRIFLSEAVSNQKGSDLTVQELEERYIARCVSSGWERLPSTEFHQALPDLMQQMFGTRKSGSCQRGGKQNRGFRSVGFTDQ